jgi:transcriptional regulator with XRE-family HTH domain
MLSTVISRDIVNYLLTQKSYSQRELAEALHTTIERIRLISFKKDGLSKEELEIILDISNMPFWEFASHAIPLEHLPEKTRKKVALCQEIAEHLRKKKKKK